MGGRLSLALLGLALFAAPANSDSYRFKEYKRWVHHYQRLMGLEQQKLIFVHYHHPDYCAWVVAPVVPGFDYTVEVGLSDPDWACNSISPRELAIHEMCHLRMRHLDITMPQRLKHEEVKACVLAYKEREKVL